MGTTSGRVTQAQSDVVGTTCVWTKFGPYLIGLKEQSSGHMTKWGMSQVQI